jgi:hypothetical protein
MRLLLSIFFPLVAYASYAQPGAGANIYDRITTQICNCIKTSQERDSLQKKNKCYEVVLDANYEELKSYGIDTVKNRDFRYRYDVYLKRFKNDESFVGLLVMQERLSDGQYSVLLRSSETKIEKQFLSAEPISEKQLKKLDGGNESIVLSYQTIYHEGKELFKIKSIVYLGSEKK